MVENTNSRKISHDLFPTAEPPFHVATPFPQVLSAVFPIYTSGEGQYFEAQALAVPAVNGAGLLLSAMSPGPLSSAGLAAPWHGNDSVPGRGREGRQQPPT